MINCHRKSILSLLILAKKMVEIEKPSVLKHLTTCQSSGNHESMDRSTKKPAHQPCKSINKSHGCHITNKISTTCANRLCLSLPIQSLALLIMQRAGCGLDLEVIKPPSAEIHRLPPLCLEVGRNKEIESIIMALT